MAQQIGSQKFGRTKARPEQSALRTMSSFSTFSMIAVLLLCILIAAQSVNAQPIVEVDEASPFESWFDRQVRAPKPKFIRFGRANAGQGQKFIRFGKRSSPEDYSGAENLDELIEAVEDLYPAQQQQLRQAAFLSAPKRAQKFIRFG